MLALPDSYIQPLQVSSFQPFNPPRSFQPSSGSRAIAADAAATQTAALEIAAARQLRLALAVVAGGSGLAAPLPTAALAPLPMAALAPLPTAAQDHQGAQLLQAGDSSAAQKARVPISKSK
jgi:hypothetical protein